MRTVWSTARLLTRKRLCPKGRFAPMGKRAPPTLDEWSGHAQLDPQLGGFAAETIELDKFITDYTSSNVSQFGEPQAIDVAWAEEATHLVRRRLVKMPRRKAVQLGDVPAEVWQIAMSDRKEDSETGHHRWCSSSFALAYCTPLLANVKAARCAPWQFHVSQGWELDKHNQLPSCEGYRVIHGLPVLGRALYRELELKSEKFNKAPEHAFGGIRGRSREGAIASQLILSHRLERAGHTFNTDFHDVKNAFPSLGHHNIQQSIEARMPDDEKNLTAECALLVQHVQSGILFLNIRNEVKYFQPAGRGTFPGASIASKVFCCTLWDETAEWLEESKRQNPVLVYESLTSARPIYLGASSFIDDLANKNVSDSPASTLSVWKKEVRSANVWTIVFLTRALLGTKLKSNRFFQLGPSKVIKTTAENCTAALLFAALKVAILDQCSIIKTLLPPSDRGAQLLLTKIGGPTTRILFQTLLF